MQIIAVNKVKISPVKNVAIIFAEIIEGLEIGFVAIILRVPNDNSFEIDIPATITQYIIITNKAI